MGLPIERFEWTEGDTDFSKDCGPTVASRSTILGGNATRLAAERLLAQLIEAAALLLRCDLDKVTQDGETFSGPGGRTATLDDVVNFARQMNIPVSATAHWEMPKIHWSFSEGRGTPYAAYHFGAQVAEVEVDTRTGKTKVLHIWAVHDVGKVVFPEGAVGQVIGGVAQGLGYGLLERVEFQNGYLMNPNFDTYLIPTAADMPPVTVEFVENDLSFGPYGAKNVAEPAMVPTTPAILNGIYQATGQRVRHTPANLERVLLGRDLKDSVVTICQDGICERARCDVTPSADTRLPEQRDAISLIVRYQGMLANRAGRPTERFTLGAGATLETLVALVWERYPTLKQIGAPHEGSSVSMIRWFVNGKVAPTGADLADGDEITLLPGAGGG